MIQVELTDQLKERAQRIRASEDSNRPLTPTFDHLQKIPGSWGNPTPQDLYYYGLALLADQGVPIVRLKRGMPGTYKTTVMAEELALDFYHLSRLYPNLEPQQLLGRYDFEGAQHLVRTYPVVNRDRIPGEHNSLDYALFDSGLKISLGKALSSNQHLIYHLEAPGFVGRGSQTIYELLTYRSKFRNKLYYPLVQMHVGADTILNTVQKREEPVRIPGELIYQGNGGWRGTIALLLESCDYLYHHSLIRNHATPPLKPLSLVATPDEAAVYLAHQEPNYFFQEVISKDNPSFSKDQVVIVNVDLIPNDTQHTILYPKLLQQFGMLDLEAQRRIAKGLAG